MRLWIENELGPPCGCGMMTSVKKMEGKFVALCFFHTSEAGAFWPLQQEAPDDFSEWAKKIEEELTQIDHQVHNKEISPEEATELWRKKFDEYLPYLRTVYNLKEEPE